MNQTKTNTATAEAPTISIPNIGEAWPGQGGVYAGYVQPHKDRGGYHLIVPTDTAADFEAACGGYGEKEPGATDDLDGLANTRDLVESAHAHPAAERCAALTIDGHNDFYLPARFELMLCQIYVVELFQRGWYCTSTQYSALTAWYQRFADGGQTINGKDSEARVRPVRRFIPSSI